MKYAYTATQSWCKDSPIFFSNGRRVDLETGYNIAARMGIIKDGDLLALWFDQRCKIVACDFPFLIANDDEPSERMLTQGAQYIHPRYVGGKVGIDRHSTNIEAFGFAIVRNDDGTYQFTKTAESRAKYSDGVSRQWQGMGGFALHPWYFVTKIKGGAA